MDVICGDPPQGYLPQRNRSEHRNWRYRQIAEGVYEFY
jgi:hypothetical protein